MPYSGCGQTIDVLNRMFAEPVVARDGKRLLARLQAGQDFRAIVADEYSGRFGEDALVVRNVLEHWSDLHFDLVEEVLKWALEKLNTQDHMRVTWQGNTESPELVTRFEVRGNELLVDFAHPASWTREVIRDIASHRRAERLLAKAS